MWTKEEEGNYIISCLPHLEKMLQQVRAKDIEVSAGKMNLSFIRNQKVYSMSWHNVYRFSGRNTIYKSASEKTKKGDREYLIPVELTYPMYLDMLKAWVFKILLYEE